MEKSITTADELLMSDLLDLHAEVVAVRKEVEPVLESVRTLQKRFDSMPFEKRKKLCRPGIEAVQRRLYFAGHFFPEFMIDELAAMEHELLLMVDGIQKVAIEIVPENKQ